MPIPANDPQASVSSSLAAGPGLRAWRARRRARLTCADSLSNPRPYLGWVRYSRGSLSTPVQVTLTDLPCRLPLLRRNVRANGWLGQTGVRAASRAALHAPRRPPQVAGHARRVWLGLLGS